MPYVREAIASLENQTYRNFEVIVQDGASRDGTANFLETLTFTRRDVVSEPDAGIGDAFNRAFGRCAGDIVGSLDSDNLLEPMPSHRSSTNFVDILARQPSTVPSS